MKVLTIFILNLIPCLAFAQEGWTTKDSIRLSKMLDGEIPIHINNAFKKELEQSLTGSCLKESNNKLDDFILDIKIKSDLCKYNQLGKPCIYVQSDLLSDSTYSKKIEYINIKGFRISSKTYIDNPYVSIERNTNISIPLTKKLNFNIYGNYALDKKRSVILPATSISYKVGAGFSYEIGKYAIIKSQTNYQYNIIQKRWEWFFGAGVSFTF
ncbi:hypothetical protein [uncultured Bacteroides sp.]|uniref:hypothetical protein n=1 Tax=uncultured Bacteroides sp. TaxID=162156 RepID=UPI0026759E15|nr:hypothetical protein [uncultured Bacteroides sp.]